MIKNGFIVLCGPSGAGKSTLIQSLMKDMDSLRLSISCTTRQKRPFETPGKEYFFLSREEFLERIKEGEFLEWTQVYGHYYGTAQTQIKQIWKENKVPITDLDLKGVKSVRKLYPQSLVVGIFADQQEVQSRISQRDAAPNENKELRLKAYKEEVSELQKYSHVQIINEHLEKAYQKLKNEIKQYLYQ